jgi:2-hydroxychromene-2-carboxylate isomerase
MKTLSFYFDVISPFAYLAFERLPQTIAGAECEVEYRPVVFGALLQHWGQKGPAEIEPKRAWTFRHVHWLAREYGIALRTPTQHPFNPLALLRLSLACAAPGGTPTRTVVESVMRHVWTTGADPGDAERLQALARTLHPRRDPRDDAVKVELRQSTGDAIARGVFGVPAMELDGRLFWGLDALPLVRAALQDDPWFDSGAWERAAAPVPGVHRKR